MNTYRYSININNREISYDIQTPDNWDSIRDTKNFVDVLLQLDGIFVDFDAKNVRVQRVA
jgi:hypothetical protein